MNNETSGYYAVIPSYVMQSKQLSANDKLVYGQVASLTTAKGYCWANNHSIGKAVGVAAGTVSKRISHLVECGFLARRVERNEKNEIVKRYLSLCQPAFSDEIVEGNQEVSTPIGQSGHTPIARSGQEREKLLDTTTRVLATTHPLAYYQLAFGQSASGLLNAKISGLAEMYGYELVNYAFYLAANDGKGYQYAKKGLLDNWINEGLRTTADVDRARLAYKAKQTAKRQAAVKGSDQQPVAGTPIKTCQVDFEDQLYNTFVNNNQNIERTIKQYQLDRIEITADQIWRVYRERT